MSEPALHQPTPTDPPSTPEQLRVRQDSWRILRTPIAGVLTLGVLGSVAWLTQPNQGRAATLRQAQQANNAPQQTKVNTLGELRSRSHTVVIEMGRGGPTYAVYNGYGQLLASGLTADQLESFRPEFDPEARVADPMPVGEPMMLADEIHIDY